MPVPFSVVSVAGSPDASAEELEFAAGLGFLLASSGYVVACGGGRGVMEAACRGAREAGGLTVGILPGADVESANPFVDIALPSGIGPGRNRQVALAGICLVAVGGRYGTLSEIAFALEAGRPVCCHGTWAGIPGVVPVETPEDALAFVGKCERSLTC
jgi:uncharacterized protein (TIGR00725 family)